MSRRPLTPRFKQRHAWLPFFENINTILFLAPVSCFDERLEEDYRINRLEDSLLLWKSICSTRLLTKTQIILFLNKCDLLKEKLKKGVKVKTYLTSYGDRPNDVNSVVKCKPVPSSSPFLPEVDSEHADLRDKFKDIHQTVSPENRASYIYATTVTVSGICVIDLIGSDLMLLGHESHSQSTRHRYDLVTLCSCSLSNRCI